MKTLWHLFLLLFAINCLIARPGVCADWMVYSVIGQSGVSRVYVAQISRSSLAQTGCFNSAGLWPLCLHRTDRYLCNLTPHPFFPAPQMLSSKSHWFIGAEVKNDSAKGTSPYAIIIIFFNHFWSHKFRLSLSTFLALHTTTHTGHTLIKQLKSVRQQNT